MPLTRSNSQNDLTAAEEAADIEEQAATTTTGSEEQAATTTTRKRDRATLVTESQLEDFHCWSLHIRFWLGHPRADMEEADLQLFAADITALKATWSEMEDGHRRDLNRVLRVRFVALSRGYHSLPR